jgi:uncharacterized membrane protein YGL010W
MRTMQNWLDDYGVSHQNKTNKAIHWVCVPIIFFSVIGLLASIPHSFMGKALDLSEAIVPYIHFGTVVVVFALVFYIRLSIAMAIGILTYCIICLFVVAFLASNEPFGFKLWQISLTLFILAWIVQFIGHKIEGAKPSFIDDLQFLLIGPAWLIHFIYKKLGIKY